METVTITTTTLVATGTAATVVVLIITNFASNANASTARTSRRVIVVSTTSRKPVPLPSSKEMVSATTITTMADAIGTVATAVGIKPTSNIASCVSAWTAQRRSRKIALGNSLAVRHPITRKTPTATTKITIADAIGMEVTAAQRVMAALSV